METIMVKWLWFLNIFLAVIQAVLGKRKAGSAERVDGEGCQEGQHSFLLQVLYCSRLQVLQFFFIPTPMPIVAFHNS